MLVPLLRVQRIDKDPEGMSAAEALDFYGRFWGVKLVLDRQAFADLGERAIDKHKMSGALRKLQEACLLDVIDVKLLAELDLPFREGRREPTWGCYFRVGQGEIEITAAMHGSKRARQLERQQRAVFDAHEAAKLAARLEKKQLPQEILSKGFPDGTHLVEVLEFLADRYDLTILLDESAFQVAGIDNVGQARIRLEPQKKSSSVAAMLQRTLDQVAGQDYGVAAVYYRDRIEIVPLHKQLRAKKPLEGHHLDRLWHELETAKSPRARLAAMTLIQGSRETLPYLKHRLAPAASPDRTRDARARALVPDLESNRFPVRQRATEELEKLAGDAVPALRDRLATRPPLEVRTRIDLLLQKEKARRVRLQPREIQALRAITVLAGIGTPEAQALLQKLAAGSPHITQTEVARAVLARLEE
jgi:hypothetical protein